MTDPTDDLQSEADRVVAHFARSDGSFLFARWGRPPAPVVFGSDEEGAEIFGAALTSVAGLAGLPTVQQDPELGSNWFVILCSEWSELTAIPHLVRLLPDLDALAARLAEVGANQHRVFGFDGEGAIRICLTLLRYDDELRKVSARTLAVSQAVHSLLIWSDRAFDAEGPVAVLAESGRAIVKPWHARLIRAAYDPALPPRSEDPSLALRLAARLAASPEG
jgi:hypothetical protein